MSSLSAVVRFGSDLFEYSCRFGANERDRERILRAESSAGQSERSKRPCVRGQRQAARHLSRFSLFWLGVFRARVCGVAFFIYIYIRMEFIGSSRRCF